MPMRIGMDMSLTGGGSVAAPELTFAGNTYLITGWVPQYDEETRIEVDFTTSPLPSTAGNNFYLYNQNSGSGLGVYLRSSGDRPRGTCYGGSTAIPLSGSEPVLNVKQTIYHSWPGVDAQNHTLTSNGITGVAAQGATGDTGFLYIGIRSNLVTGFEGVIHELRVYDTAISGGTLIHKWTINTGTSVVPDSEGGTGDATVVIGSGEWG